MSEQPTAADTGSSEGSREATPVADPEPLKTVPIRSDHRIADFRCAKSERVQNFFMRDMPRLIDHGYCRVLILPNPADPSGIWGYYTLSPAQLQPDDLTRTQRRRVIGGIPISMMRIGFMGRDDRAPPGIGGTLLIDAARRVHRSEDTNAWALTLDAEGGPANARLFSWYKSMGFVALRDSTGAERGAMYCPLASLLPELQRGG
jgi:hypothetical protein